MAKPTFPQNLSHTSIRSKIQVNMQLKLKGAIIIVLLPFQ